MGHQSGTTKQCLPNDQEIMSLNTNNATTICGWVS